MKKNAIFIIIGLIVIGGIIALASHKKEENGEHSAVKKNNFALLDVNHGIKCEQTSAVLDGNAMTTTMYFYKDLFRYDAVMKDKVQGQKDMHSITRDGYTYIWGDGTIGSMMGGNQKGKGMKIKEDEDEMAPQAPVDIESLRENNFKVPGLRCEAWNDTSVFDLPKDIEFQDMASLMNMNTMMNGGGVPTNMDECSLCEQIPNTEARKECEKSCQEEE